MIESIKDLEKLLKLCRKQGVTELKWAGAEIKLGELVEQKADTSSLEEDIDDPLADFPDGPLTAEELTFFATGGLPKDNPYRQPQ